MRKPLSGYRRVTFSPWDGARTTFDVLLDGIRVGSIVRQRGGGWRGWVGWGGSYYSVEIPQTERREFARYGEAKGYARKALRGKVAARSHR